MRTDMNELFFVQFEKIGDSFAITHSRNLQAETNTPTILHAAVPQGSETVEGQQKQAFIYAYNV